MFKEAFKNIVTLYKNILDLEYFREIFSHLRDLLIIIILFLPITPFLIYIGRLFYLFWEKYKRNK